MGKLVSAAEAVARIQDGAVVTVSSSSALGCPDKVLEALGARFRAEGHPRGITTLHPIAAGDMYGVKGVDHIAQDGLLARVIGGSYPSGSSNLPMPEIWKMVSEDRIPAYNVPSGILFDMHRDVAARKAGVLTKVGLQTFVDPTLQGCAMNAKAAAAPIVQRVEFGGETWLHFPNIIPNVCILRATTADERGNLTYEHEGAYLGGLDQAIAVRNHGGLVIAKVKRLTAAGSLRPHDVRVPLRVPLCVLCDKPLRAPKRARRESLQRRPRLVPPQRCGRPDKDGKEQRLGARLGALEERMHVRRHRQDQLGRKRRVRLEAPFGRSQIEKGAHGAEGSVHIRERGAKWSGACIERRGERLGRAPKAPAQHRKRSAAERRLEPGAADGLVTEKHPHEVVVESRLLQRRVAAHDGARRCRGGLRMHRSELGELLVGDLERGDLARGALSPRDAHERETAPTARGSCRSRRRSCRARPGCRS
jgi:acyl CoA:acetate/3-ketoacid CoA transferase alpha subunit